MRERPLALVLLVPPFVYVAGVTVAGFPIQPDAVVSAVPPALCLAAAPLVALGYRHARSIALVLLGVALGATVGLPLALPADLPMAGDLAAGLLLGLPLLAVGYLAAPDTATERRLVGYGLVLLGGIALLAARSRALTSGGAPTGSNFVTAFYSTNADQVSGLLGLLSGRGYLTLPLHAPPDAAFTALVAGSFLGLLLLLLRPRTDLGTPLPVAASASLEEDRDELLGGNLSPAQRSRFVARSRGGPPRTVWPPVLLPAVVAGGATLVFVTGAFVEPDWALLGSTVGLAALVGLVVLVVERPGAVRTLFGPARSSGRSPPGATVADAGSPRRNPNRTGAPSSTDRPVTGSPESSPPHGT